MTLNDLKAQYEQICTNELDKYNCTKIADMYLSSFSIAEKNKYMSYLICSTWNLLQKIYYQNNNVLTAEDCYDIFIQTLHYVIKMHVWTNPNSTLYKDDKAFEKAMAITIQSRRKNFLKAKYRQKRVINSTKFSLDSMEEDFQDGYFSIHEDNFDDECIPELAEIIKSLFYEKKYVASFILEAIIYNNIFTDEYELDMRKLRKYLRNIDFDFCNYFANKYDLNIDEVLYCLRYFSNDAQNKLDTKIAYAFTLLRSNDIIKNILNR